MAGAVRSLRDGDLRLMDAPWPCWIEVDLDAIRHNVRQIRALVHPRCEVMAVVKSHGYGHGAVPVARAALEAGATWLGVARVREGVQLRNAGVEAPILLLGPFHEGEVRAIAEHQLQPTVISIEQARMVSAAAQAAGRDVLIHLKVDTGLGRYGAPLQAIRDLVPRLLELPGVRVEGLYSHFATADEPDSVHAADQLKAFLAGRAELESEGYRFRITHIAASAGTLGVNGSHLDMVRVGLSLYGLYPSPHLVPRASLRPALSFHSRVARVFRVDPGQSVGYGRTFVASEPTIAALIPVGYADGLPRSHSNRGAVLVNGHRAPLIGRVSMDQCVANVSECGSVREGDPVVLIGSQGGETISCDEFAERSGTVTYEVLTSLGFRVPRIYKSGGAPVGVGFLDEGKLEVWP